MANTHLKIYNFNDSEPQIKRKKAYKDLFKSKYIAKLPKDDDEDEEEEGEKVDPDQERVENIDEREVEWVDAFLSAFVGVSDSAKKVD